MQHLGSVVTQCILHRGFPPITLLPGPSCGLSSCPAADRLTVPQPSRCRPPHGFQSFRRRPSCGLRVIAGQQRKAGIAGGMAMPAFIERPKEIKPTPQGREGKRKMAPEMPGRRIDERPAGDASVWLSAPLQSQASVGPQAGNVAERTSPSPPQPHASASNVATQALDASRRRGPKQVLAHALATWRRKRLVPHAAIALSKR